VTESNLRFGFGDNWRDFSTLVDQKRLDSATERLVNFLGNRDLSGLSFADIGCGSGLHSVAAEKLGAKSIWAIDLDIESVETTRDVAKFFGTARITVEQADILTLRTDLAGTFDVVYSWGVLHHTGNMFAALDQTAKLVKPGGYLAVALYGKTRYCELWKKIKRKYCRGGAKLKKKYEDRYIWAFGLYLLLRGQTLSKKKREYVQKRGMNFEHDVKDWLGGYPYESLTADQLRGHLGEEFDLISSNTRKRSGLFGSGCDEYLLRKTSDGSI